MHIHFKEIAFKNILSYGAMVTTIDFESGLNLIAGKNGSGKSTFLDALSFCLYGKPYRKVRIEELINRKNKRQMWTRVRFEIDNNEYEIERGRAPNILHIQKNGKEIDELSTKALTQEELDRIIGVDYIMFKQIISLAVNYNKPFLTLSTGEKRGIVESIFNIKVFSEMMKLSKSKITSLKTQSDLDNKSLSIMEQNIRQQRKQMRELQSAIKNFKKNQEADLQQIYSQRKKNQQEIKQNIEHREFLNKQLSKIKVEDTSIFRNELEKIDNKLGVLTYRIEQLKKINESITKNSICPTCNHKITPAYKIKEIKRIKIEQKDIIDKQEKINLKKCNLQSRIDKANQNAIRKEELRKAFDSNVQKCNWLSKTIDDYNQQAHVVNKRKINFNIEQAESDLKSKSDEYTLLYEQHLSMKHELHTYETAISILSDNGIKAFFFRKYLPLLNKKINEYLRRFELSVYMEFNNIINETIWNQNNLQKEVSYFTFSEGEKKRIDLSILLAFIDVAKTICNWNTNLLMFDELLDSAVDDDGLEQIIDCLRSIIKGKHHKAVYVVSHRLRESDQFDRTIMLEKKKGFSSLVKK